MKEPKLTQHQQDWINILHINHRGLVVVGKPNATILWLLAQRPRLAIIKGEMTVKGNNVSCAQRVMLTRRGHDLESLPF